ncbi:hypothetical protein pb186bvf_010291 [Paramecium bursaria]
MLDSQSYDFAQLVLKYYSPKVTKQTKEKQVVVEDIPIENTEKMDSKTKYSIDYNKFQQYLENPNKPEIKTKEEQEMDDLIKSNPYLSQMACTHDRRKEREIYDKSTDEKLENADYFKKEGNKKFQEGNYEQASYFYQKALLHFDYTFPDTPEEEKKFQQLQEQCNNNMAQCKFMQQKYEDALNYCYQVLKQNPNNQKAIFRKAKIYLAQREFEKCEETLSLLQPADPDVQVLKGQLK